MAQECGTIGRAMLQFHDRWRPPSANATKGRWPSGGPSARA